MLRLWGAFMLILSKYVGGPDSQRVYQVDNTRAFHALALSQNVCVSRAFYGFLSSNIYGKRFAHSINLFSFHLHTHAPSSLRLFHLCSRCVCVCAFFGHAG